MSPDAARDPSSQDNEDARLHRWRIDFGSGDVRSTPLDDEAAEFPRIDERLVGRRHRFGYMAVRGPEPREDKMPVLTAIKKYDLERGASDTRTFGAHNGVGEPLFVPRHATAEEDDGYVLVLHYDHERDQSDFVILDARNIAGQPLARIRLPHRVPYGFHGNWVSADA